MSEKIGLTSYFFHLVQRSHDALCWLLSMHSELVLRVIFFFAAIIIIYVCMYIYHIMNVVYYVFLLCGP